MREIYLKLRNNIILDSDLQLAEREIRSLFDNCKSITRADCESAFQCLHKVHLLSNIREGQVIGYAVSGNKIPMKRILCLLSFIQEVWTFFEIENTDPAISHSVDNAFCYIPLMTMSEFLYYTKTPSVEAAKRITLALALGSSADKDIQKSIDRVKTSAPHLHSFHTYKAKFFPRFVHSLIVSDVDVTKENLKVCDPYVGSGTTLIESSLMGFESCGIDIDALSCFISQVKSDSLNIDGGLQPSPTDGLFAKVGKKKFMFPKEIRRKFERWGSLEEMETYQKEISNELNIIDGEDSPYKELHKIALSDALTRKFNVRMMGTGSGRFALEIGKTRLSSIIKSDMVNSLKGIATIQTVKGLYGIETPSPTVINGSATKRDIPNDSLDIIITSPPYIPASSGREDYLVGKLTSLTALGLYNEDRIAKYQTDSVGSMGAASEDLSGLPNAVVDLYNWLLKDELRSIKARPIVAYYRSLIESLKEDKRTIKEGARIVYIIGKETVFYSSATKEILYKVECDKIFKEIALAAGLQIVDTIDIELDKKDNIARPRGSDKYYECAIVMCKNSSQAT